MVVKSLSIKKSKLKAWAKENMKGVENETIPSFTPDFSELDEEGIRWDVQQAIRHGFFSTLCTCEAGLTFEEAKRFVEVVADEAKDKILVSVTLLFNTLDENFEMLEHAEKVGCDAVLLGYPPSYYPQSEQEIYRLTEEMCESTNLAVILYPHPQFNFERFHPSGFPIKLLEKFAEFDNVVAVKVGEHGLAAECARRFGDKVLVSMPQERYLPLNYLAFKQQWIGAGPYEVYQSPEDKYLVRYFNFLMEGEWDKAMEIYWQLTPARILFEQHHEPIALVGTYNWNLHKLYQWLVGGNGGYVRQPCMKVYIHDIERTKFMMMQAGINVREAPYEEFFMGRSNYAKLKKK